MSIRASRTTAAALVTTAAFTDILAYSIAVPVLPDLSRRLGASPTMIGFLFGAFGVSVLLTSVPMGAVSDRIGRRGPLVAGAGVLAASTVLFAFAASLPWLFAARLVQGAADAVTWVVGFALIADLYHAEERGRVMGLVMSGTTVGFMIGPSLGGWLYESAGPQVPYLVVAALSAVCAVGFAWMQAPPHAADTEPVRLLALLRVPDVAVCAATVVLGGGTLAMIEPTLSLFLGDQIGLGPARIGLVIGCGAVVSATLHPAFGRIADRVGGRRLMIAGLAGIGRDAAGAVADFEFHERRDHLRGVHRSDRDDGHTVARVHGRRDVRLGGAFVRRRLRRVQLRLGTRAARGALHRRCRIRAGGVRARSCGHGRPRCCRSHFCSLDPE